jgi:hypothetical protein
MQVEHDQEDYLSERGDTSNGSGASWERFHTRFLRASPVASLKKHPAQMIWSTCRITLDKKRLKICTEKRPFPAASLKQRPDACILI